MPRDAIGRKIEVGDVCVHVTRSSSSMYFEPIIIRQLLPDGVKGDKVITGFTWRGDKPRLQPSKLIQRADHLVLTGLTEDQVREQFGLEEVE